MKAKFFVSDKAQKEAPNKLKELLEKLEENVSEFDQHIAMKCCIYFRNNTKEIFDQAVGRGKKIKGALVVDGLSLMGILAISAAAIITPPLVLVSPWVAGPGFAAIMTTFTAIYQGFKLKQMLKSIYGKHKVEFELGKDGSINANLCFGLVPLV